MQNYQAIWQTIVKHFVESGKDVSSHLNHISNANVPTLEERPTFVSREMDWEINFHLFWENSYFFFFFLVFSAEIGASRIGIK